MPPTTPSDPYRISQIDVQAQISDLVAQVNVSQTFVNTGSTTLQVAFLFPLPYDGAIDQLTLLVDGKEYPARLLPRDEARARYEEIVRKNRDPALLEWIGSGMFQTSVFPIPPGAERKVVLRYSQLLRQDQGIADFLFPLSTARYTSKPIETLNIDVRIEAPQPIKSVYSPTHQVEIERDGRRATVRFRGKDLIPTSDFRLLYDIGTEQLAARVISYWPRGAEGDDEGYFLLLATPTLATDRKAPPPKTVVFVVDRSGSMSGKKIEQAKAALRQVLNNLREGDLFNIVAYDNEVVSFRPELQRFNDRNRGEALAFVDGIYAGGSTNISGALAAALGQLTDASRPSYVLFLTDGLPTAGETNEMKIVEQATAANGVRARIINFGVGYDVNSRLLDRLARANFGSSEFVRPDEDIEDRVSRVYRRIVSPVLTGVSLTWDFDQPRGTAMVSRVYPRGEFDLFAGETLVLVGRYKQAGRGKVTVRGTVGGREQTFDFPVDLVKRSRDNSHAFVERLWAIRRVGEIIDELDLKGRNEELVAELVALSTRHGILTPYTSFLADETTQLNDLAGNSREALRRSEQLAETDGAWGFYQRGYKADLQQANQIGTMPAAAAPHAEMRGQTFAGRGGAGPVPADRLARPEAERVRQVAQKTFFQRGGQWVDSSVDESQLAKATRVRQFSDEYFQLAQQYGKELSQYLVFDEATLVALDGQVWLIEP